MENLVPLGTGNSRLMKSNIPSNTTLAQLIQMWNNGTFPYDIGPLNSAGISQQGTPLNKDTLLKDATAALFGLTNTAVPDDALNILSKAVTMQEVTENTPVSASSLTVGQVVKFLYNGSPREYRVVHKGNPDTSIYDSSCNGVWFYEEKRIDGQPIDSWSSTSTNTWKNSKIKDIPDDDVLPNLDQGIAGLIKEVKIPYTDGVSTSVILGDGYPCKMFLLSAVELGTNTGYEQEDGAKLDYFESGSGESANNKRKFQETQDPSEYLPYWTRTGSRTSATTALAVNELGEGEQLNVRSYDRDIRSAFILPSNSQLYQRSDGVLVSSDGIEWQTADVQGNPITIGPQIATGSYVGTGTYGANNPNTLTFDFEPKLVVIKSNISMALISNWQKTAATNNCPMFHIQKVTGDSNYFVGIVCTFSGNTISYYNTSAPVHQLNAKGTIYTYVAIG